MPVAMGCRCGQVRGQVDIDRAYARATCYCNDCQAYARFLGTPGIADADGGSDFMPMAPAGVRFEAGLEQVACMALSEKGLLRWYAACCRTPLGNTPNDAKVPYAGMYTLCLAASQGVLDAAVGPRDRTVLNAGSAAGKVRSTPLPFAIGGLRILANILVRRLRGEGGGPFFFRCHDSTAHPDAGGIHGRSARGIRRESALARKLRHDERPRALLRCPRL